MPKEWKITIEGYGDPQGVEEAARGFVTILRGGRVNVSGAYMEKREHAGLFGGESTVQSVVNGGQERP